MGKIGRGVEVRSGGKPVADGVFAAEAVAEADADFKCWDEGKGGIICCIAILIKLFICRSLKVVSMSMCRGDVNDWQKIKK